MNPLVLAQLELGYLDMVYLVLWGLCMFAAVRYGPAELREMAKKPIRDIGVTEIDLIVAIGLYWGGKMVTPALAGLVFTTGPDGALSSAQIVQLTWMELLISGVPFAAYLWYVASKRDGGLRDFGLLPTEPGVELKHGLYAAPLALAVVSGTIIIALWLGDILQIERPPQLDHALLRVADESTQVWVTAGVVIGAVLLAPLFEEIFYRGVVQTMLLSLFGPVNGPRMRLPAALIAGIAFGVVHAGNSSWQSVSGLVVLGIILGLIYEKYNSLLPCFIVHAVFNGVNIAMVLMPVAAPPEATPDGPPSEVIETAVAALVTMSP